jgi:excisionase family DNA binding protein
MAKGKNVLTTGDVAKICNVAPRTVSKWFDKGQLKGYRIPGSKDRRIPVNELIRFMKQNNMPTDILPVGAIRILVVDSNVEASEQLTHKLLERTEYEVQTVHSNFETGFVAQKFAPHVILVSLLGEGIDARDICKTIRSNKDLQTIKIIAITNHLSEAEAAALIQNGFDGNLEDISNLDEVVRKIEEVTAIVY